MKAKRCECQVDPAELLCFTKQTLQLKGRWGAKCCVLQVLHIETAGGGGAKVGGVRQQFRLCSRYVRAMSVWARVVIVSQSWRGASQRAESYWGKQLQIARRLLMVAIGCKWWRGVIGECNCRLLDALEEISIEK